MATVTLYTSGNVQVGSSQATGSNGLYLFTGLTPGDYYVKVTPPSGYLFSPQNVAADDTIDSDANVTTGVMPTTTLSSGEDDRSWDAGVYKAGIVIKKYVNEISSIGGEGLTPGIGNSRSTPAVGSVSPRHNFTTRCLASVTARRSRCSRQLDAAVGVPMRVGRHAVAAILNAANTNVNYLYAVATIQSMVLNAYNTNTFEPTKNLLETQNQLGTT